MKSIFKKQADKLIKRHEELLSAKNKKVKNGNGIFDRYKNPILTAAHTPVIWRYDLD
jgi:4-O-beta-D-mannosyl-D-glucose phosphorylase